MRASTKVGIQYPDLPDDIDEIQLELQVEFPGGGTDFNKTTLDIPSFHMNIAESPITGNLKLRDMVTDPFISTALHTQLDLGRMKDAIALEGMQDLAGIITADVDLEGRLLAIEEERYNDFKASGQMIMQSLDIAGDSIPVPIHITTAHMNFTPRALELSNFNGTIGKSDLTARGRIGNYIGYALKDELLIGTFEVESKVLDLNQFLEEPAEQIGSSAAATAELAENDFAGVIQVPANVDFDLNASIGKVLYENMELNDVRGKVVLKDKVASLSKVKMKVLGGDVILNGNYSTSDPVKPRFDFGIDIAGMDIPSLASTFNTISQLAPVAKQCEGQFSSAFNFATTLDGNMNPIFSSLTGGGGVETAQVIVENFKPLLKIAESLKLDNWKKQRVDNVDLEFEFIDGKVAVKPFKIKLDGIESTIGGTMSFEQDLDYNVQMKIPMQKLGGQANELLSGLLGQVNSLGLNLSAGEFVNMNFKVTGKMNDPKIKPTIIGQEGTTVKDAVKDLVKQEVQEVKEEVVKDVKAEAQAQADKIIAQAQEQADALTAEAKRASDKVKEEGYRAAKKLEDEAKGPLAKAGAKIAADKLRKETDEKAKKITDEADKKAQSLMSDARSKSDALLK